MQLKNFLHGFSVTIVLSTVVGISVWVWFMVTSGVEPSVEPSEVELIDWLLDTGSIDGVTGILVEPSGVEPIDWLLDLGLIVVTGLSVCLWVGAAVLDTISWGVVLCGFWVFVCSVGIPWVVVVWWTFLVVVVG